MKAGWKVELIANSFMMKGGIKMERPYKVILEDGDPILNKFKNKPQFKLTSININETPSPTAVQSPKEVEEKGVIFVKDLETINKKVKETLMKNGFSTAEDVLADDENDYETILALPGIGEAVLETLVKSCGGTIEYEDEENEDEENEN